MRRERNPLAVRGPIRLRGTGHAARPDGLQRSARGGHNAKRPVLFLLSCETNPFPIRRPAGGRLILRRFGQPLQAAAVGIGHIQVRPAVHARNKRHLAAAGRGRGAHVRPVEMAPIPARARGEIVMKDVHVVELVGNIVQRQVPRHPARRRHEVVVFGHRLGVVAVEVGDVNLAGRAVLPFEGHLGLRDAFGMLRQGRDKIIRERMNLPPQGCAGVGFGNQRALVVGIAGPRLEVAVVAARNQVLRGLGVGEREALHVEVKLQCRGRLAC